jgi:hypothetical protein
MFRQTLRFKAENVFVASQFTTCARAVQFIFCLNTSANHSKRLVPCCTLTPRCSAATKGCFAPRIFGGLHTFFVGRLHFFVHEPITLKKVS